MSENEQQFQDIAPGTVINGYRIDHELGRGAMAVVYLAEQLDLERQVAFKILSAELAADKEFIGRFFNEARAAATLSHPHQADRRRYQEVMKHRLEMQEHLRIMQAEVV
ncbi:MAG: FAD-dependent oxidoreductase, partial [Victivallales bacterium]|nr:FAD-dependent oxidoreductase [Victivallales bacterium]